MKLKLGIVMDPIEQIKPHKDSSLAMLLAAQKRGWSLHYLQQHDLYLEQEIAWGTMRPLSVADDAHKWFELGEKSDQPLHHLDAILMRKDPPFNMDYIYSTYLLERAEAAGCLVVNRASSLRDANEKLFTSEFPQCCAPTLVSSQAPRLLAFLQQHQDIVVKPLDGMGGESIFRLRLNDPNTSTILEVITHKNQRLIMAQKFLPEISAGDKRILLVNGVPAPLALARIPAKGELRGNIAAGGRGVPVPLSDRDHWICEQVAPTLREKGLLFVGLDVIGDYLTEINVTSPTCIRELDREGNLDIAGDLMECIAAQLTEQS
ncbi:MAG: glutathione synthase [Gammaproteobacteria bacterium]|nr:glutathione synthase [Gammaproteobacteria bacterium]